MSGRACLGITPECNLFYCRCVVGAYRVVITPVKECAMQVTVEIVLGLESDLVPAVKQVSLF